MRTIRNIIRFPRTINVNINNSPKTESKGINYHNYSVFIFGSLLAISEALPFVEVEGNGILHVLKKVFEYYKGI